MPVKLDQFVRIAGNVKSGRRGGRWFREDKGASVGVRIPATSPAWRTDAPGRAGRRRTRDWWMGSSHETTWLRAKVLAVLVGLLVGCAGRVAAQGPGPG